MIRVQSLIGVTRANEPCGECGEACQKCLNKNSLDLHHEIEELKAKLADSNSRMIQMEIDFAENQRTLELENVRIQDELLKLRDRYDRLMDSHKKLQRVNHNLECKLLTVVEQLENDKRTLRDQSMNLNHHLLEAKSTICDLKDELDRYRQDCNVAVQLLQCRPSHFVPHKLTNLPPDLQQRVKSYVGQRQLLDLDESAQFGPNWPHQQPAKIIRVPMATFPPTAIVYSVNQANGNTDITDSSDCVIPAAVIAGVLTKPDDGRHRSGRTVICRRCLVETSVVDTSTQTRSTGSKFESSFNGSCKEDDATVGRSQVFALQQIEGLHPKVHRQRYNSVESQN